MRLSDQSDRSGGMSVTADTSSYELYVNQMCVSKVSDISLHVRMTSEEVFVRVCCARVFIPSVLPFYDYTPRAVSSPRCRMPPPGSLSTNAS